MYTKYFTLSESPFDIKNVFNNVFFTLLMSLFMLILCKKYNNKYQLFIIICFFSSLTIYSDWGVIGPIIVFMMYFSNKNTSKVRTSLIFSVFLILIYYLYSRIYNPLYLITSLGCLMSYYPIKKYNGQLGNSSKLIQYTFYFLYPIHMYILKIIYDFWIIRQDNMRIFLFLLYN
ncbi:TraX family protein [Vagococcus fluvialis]|uniref:TraX family protein n=1 Tax=Vagococcus fluvialis TaxID=2738 RepID=UPI003D10EB3B